jgi:integrase
MTDSKRKAANGEGSIRQGRRKNGSPVWFVELSLGYGPNGKRRRTRRTAKSYAEAKKLRIKLLNDQQQGLVTERHLDTVRSFGTWWVREVKPQSIRPSTAADYEDRLNRYVFPTLGAVRLVDLTPRHVQGLLNKLNDEGFSASTINGARRVLSGLCKHATRVGVLPYNPVQATDPVNTSNQRTQVRQSWTEEEAQKVLDHAIDEPDLDLFLHLMLWLGLRPGEALGVRWEDVDDGNRKLHITGTLKSERRITTSQKGSVRLTRNAPKTKASMRSLHLGPEVHAALARQRTRQTIWAAESGPRWQESGYLVTTRVGSPVSSSNLRKRFMRFLSSIGVRYIRMHDMRHTVAKVALNGGLPIEQVSQVLGHTRIDTTKQIYAGHVPMYTENFTAVMSTVMKSNQIHAPETVEDLQQIWQHTDTAGSIDSSIVRESE